MGELETRGAGDMDPDEDDETSGLDEALHFFGVDGAPQMS